MPQLRHPVFREQHPACIDWCSHAKECIGPEVYESLKPEPPKGFAAVEGASPLARISQEHDEVVRQVSALRGAILCLRLAGKAPGPQFAQTFNQGSRNLSQVLEFFDEGLKGHFRREEEVLFPLVEKHIGTAGSPTQLLLREHVELGQGQQRLKEKLAELQKVDPQLYSAVASEVHDIGSQMAHLLLEHIKKENESLLPLAQSLLGEEELGELSRQWEALGLGAGARQ